ncbi:MAG: hypothetical protein IPG64_16350 [Haliea sp.]|nr:hypothetical protein [Haliea sp.]
MLTCSRPTPGVPLPLVDIRSANEAPQHADHPQQGDHAYAALEMEFAQHPNGRDVSVWALTVTLERNPWELRVFGAIAH